MKSMELTEEQLDWLAEHFYKPGRAVGKPSPLEQSLIDLSLVMTETFPFGNGPDFIILSLTRRGLSMAVLYRSEDVKEYYDRFDFRVIRKAQMGNVPLDRLSEFLSSDDAVTREVASDRLAQLRGEKQNA